MSEVIETELSNLLLFIRIKVLLLLPTLLEMTLDAQRFIHLS